MTYSAKGQNPCLNPSSPPCQGGAWLALQETARLSPPLIRRGRESIVALVCLLLMLALATPLYAKEAAPLAQDEAAEKRLIAISSELRCLVCQNESLAGSNAELAQDLRREIRTMILDGKSDGEIMDFMVSRYGDFVRYRPPLKGTTLLLWFGPALLFAGGLGGLFLFLRRRSRVMGDVPLSEAERQQAERLLHSDESKS